MNNNRKVYIKAKNGHLEIENSGKWYTYWREPYRLMLVVPWFLFLGIIALFYILVNVFFACIYIMGDHIANARSGDFFDAYFFSVQTFASIGYGAMYPKTFIGNLIVSFEAIVGLVSIALLTGISFARFSRPTARIMFSKFAVISSYNGQSTLMVRCANARGNQVLEAQVRLTLLRDEITMEGNPIRRVYDLKLLRDRTYSFSLGWTIFHPTDDSSPLFNLNSNDLQQQNTTLIITINGHDETVAQTVHDRHDYHAGDVIFNYRFVDMITFLPNGDRIIDYSKIHKIEAIEIS
jgi:inward rectifier potassium channel